MNNTSSTERAGAVRMKMLGTLGKLGRRFIALSEWRNDEGESQWVLMDSADNVSFASLPTTTNTDGSEVCEYFHSEEEAQEALARYLEQRGATLEPVEPPRTTGRKPNNKLEVVLPSTGTFPAPNIQNHGTRNLGIIVAGGADWQQAPEGGAMYAVIDGQRAGMIEFRPSGEDEAGRIIDALAPRTLQTMVCMSALLCEKTRGQPFNRAETITLGELAREMRYKPDSSRKIDPDILHRLGRDLLALTKIQTFGASGSYDKKIRRAPSGWVAPMLVITAYHTTEYITLPNGDRFPYTFDAMLGRNWAEAFTDRHDVIQIAPGILDLHPVNDAQAIKLAWFYLTEFRYAMTKPGPRRPLRIEALCQSARLELGDLTKHAGRFLERLEGWHQRLQQLGVIGVYERTPAFDADQPGGSTERPRTVFAEGTYTVQPPGPVIAAYQRPKELATGRRKGHRV